MDTQLGLSPFGIGPPLPPDTPLGHLQLSDEVIGQLQTLGITKVMDVASASPSHLLGQVLPPEQFLQVATALEGFFISLDQADMRICSESFREWEPYLPHPAVIRQVRLRRWLPSTSVEKLFPKDGEPEPPGLSMPVRNLYISVRASNCLKDSGIANVHELALASPRLLFGIHNLGFTTLCELAAVVEMYFGSLEPGLMATYEESYESWKSLFIGRAPSPRGICVRLSKPDLGPVSQEWGSSNSGLPAWLSKPDLDPAMEVSPPDPTLHDDPLLTDTPFGHLPLSGQIINRLQTLGITKLKDLASTTPEQLLGQGLSAEELLQVSTALERFFTSLVHSGMPVYSGSFWEWEPYLPQAEAIRQVRLSRWLPNTSIERLFPKDDAAKPPGLSMPVQNLDVSGRASNCLKNSEIANVHELALASPRLLLHVRNLGPTTLCELAAVVEVYFRSLEPSAMKPYEESYPLWKPLLTRRAPSPERVRLWSTKPEVVPVAEKSPPDPAIYGNPPRPPGLNVPISDLTLPTRALTWLERWRVTNLHELALIEPLRFLGAANFGRRSLDPVAKVLKEYFDSLARLGHWKVYESSYQAWERYLPNQAGCGGPEPGPADPTSPPPSITEIISTFLSQQNERNRGILVKRFALMAGSSPERLVAIGRRTGLTRERIRQIAAKLQNKVAAAVRRHHPGLVPMLRSHMGKVAVATMDEMVNLISNSDQSAEFHFANCARMLIRSISGVHSIDPAGRLWTSLPSIDRAFYPRVVKEARREMSRTPTDLPNLVLVTARNLGCCGQEIEAVRIIIHDANSTFAGQPSNRKIFSLEAQGVEVRRRAFAYDYICARGVPTTILEVLDGMAKMEPDILPHFYTGHGALYKLSSLLKRDDRFAWAGLAAYGLREWGYEPGVTSIALAIVALLRKAGPLTLPKIQKSLGRLYRADSNSSALALRSELGKNVTRDSHGRWRCLP